MHSTRVTKDWITTSRAAWIDTCRGNKTSLSSSHDRGPIEGGGDLAVLHSLRDQRRHLGLPHGQRLQIGSGMLRP